MSLPRNVRQDLELIEVASFEDGSPRWRLYDPVANQFFDLGWLELERLEQPYAASIYDGALDVRDGKDGAIIPQRATYLPIYLSYPVGC